MRPLHGQRESFAQNVSQNVKAGRPGLTQRRRNGAQTCAVAAWLLAGMVLIGCGQEKKSRYAGVSKPPVVTLIKPDLRTITRVVGQPSFIESYERTSIFPKLTGYIEKWNVDIGDQVKKGDVLATLFVPELVEDLATKKATVKLCHEKVDLAKKLVDVADADVKAAQSRVNETKAIVNKYQADVERWDSEVQRLKKEVSRGVVDPQILLESTNQWKASQASVEAANATVQKADAELLSKMASLEKAKVDVLVASADLMVADSDEKRVAAWVGYITLTAPFDGVIVARNANTGDFVTPVSGDPTSNQRSPYLSPGNAAAPIYVVDRNDVVRIFVDIPEEDANDVHIGNSASVMVKAYLDEPLPCSVTRTAWALNVKSRTLRAEIDLPNPKGKLLPGMYAYAKVTIDSPDVRAIPVGALTSVGDRTYCWFYNKGHAERREVRTGVSDGKWIEVTNIQQDEPKSATTWLPVTGTESVIMGDLSVLTDGDPVDVGHDVAQSKSPEGARIATQETATAPSSSNPEHP